MKRAVVLRYDGAAGPTDVVVATPPRSLAGAVGPVLDDAEEAPVVVCAGEGELAMRIEREARRCGVPVVRDVPLCDALAELGVGEPIPEALYEAVAAILRELVA